MFRSLLLLFGVLAITCFEFIYYPGHTYLAGESQTLVAMMERLDTPGFLSRDLAAINPNLTYTIYDEVTLFLSHISKHGIQDVLATQQFAFRWAGVTGLLLLSLSFGMRSLPALAAAAVLSAGAELPGLHLALTDPEPTPFAFAFAATLLAVGLLTQRKPLLAGLAGGIALAYQPSVGLLFWLLVFAGLVFRRDARALFRATLPAFLVCLLLLANAAQLQSGGGESHPVFQRVSSAWMHLQLQRTPELWVSTWGFGAVVFYVALGSAGCLALHVLWKEMDRLVRWIVLLVLVGGLASVPASLLGLEVFRRAFAGEIQLTRTLCLSVMLALSLCSAAAWRTVQEKRVRQALWFVPVVAAVVLCHNHLPSSAQMRENQSVRTIAAWAEQDTWGGSMFLFPDAGKTLIPGEFRGLAIRAVYTDWESGSLIKTFPAFGMEWARRWQEAGGSDYSVSRLQQLLALQVEYIVLHKRNQLLNVKPEIATPDFVVYDAQVLWTAAHRLRGIPES